jgi:hypothetical protein
MRWAEACGHRIVALRPGLVALVTKKETFRLPPGLTLKNIRLVFRTKGKAVSTEIGELLFTDFGISGPLVLTHSGSVADWLMQGKDVSAHIDYKPALSIEQLEQRVLRECKANPRRNIASVLKELLPASLVEVFLARLGVPKDKKANQITAVERKRIAGFLHDFPLEIKATRPIAEAMVTKGGVSLQQIDPRTMESRLVKGLYFCGEMIDIDADTGGFNLQAAFSTGYLAGESAAQGLHNQ